MRFFILISSLCLCAIVCDGAAIADEIVFLPLNVTYPVKEQIDVSPRAKRSVGGTDAPGSEFPYYARLHLHLGGGAFILCGGSLISRLHILTADHCIPNNLKNIDAYLGVAKWNGPDAEMHAVAWYMRRGQGTKPFVDLTILGLPKQVTVKMNVAPIALPRLSQNNDFFLNRGGLIVGYGGVSNNKLQQTPIRFSKTSDCGTSSGMICAGGRDGPHQSAAGGDSGGPIVLLDNGIHILVGTLSFTYGNHVGGSHIPQFLPWINQITGIPMAP